ncbi:MAG: dipicolinate synthase subunit B [Clostridia bacterium]|nr:dipicolinate synthase subunit B [Clostridia bacterium]
MNLEGLTVGFAVTGSFCTLETAIKQIAQLKAAGANVIPIMSEIVEKTDTRFGTAEHFKSAMQELSGNTIISTIKDAEPIGPKKLLDALVIAPCTGNTISKLANGINDTCVTMAAKAHLRNLKPLIVAVSTNDALGASARNIGQLLLAKNIFFVPYGQDDPIKKPNSMIADFNLVVPATIAAVEGKQLQPIIIKST